MAVNGANWQNGTDMTVGLASFSVPGIGWVIGAVCFIADPIVKKTIGKGIGEHVGDAVNATSEGSKSIFNTLQNGLSNVESYFRRTIPR